MLVLSRKLNESIIINQQHWREVEWHYRELARQLTRRIGEEAIRIARLHRSGGA